MKNKIAIGASIALLLGCFLPWVQFGGIISRSGVNSTEGILILILSIISGILAINNNSKDTNQYNFIYLIIGLVSIIIMSFMCSKLSDYTDKISEGMDSISNMFAHKQSEINTSPTAFWGSGIFLVFAGSLGLVYSGFELSLLSSLKIEKPNNDNLLNEIVSPKYAKDIIIEDNRTEEEIENDRYKNELTLLYESIRNQKNVFGNSNIHDTLSHIDKLCKSKEEALYLLKVYNTVYQKDLINELKSLNSGYDDIKRNVSKFIELEIIETSYPHSLK